MIIVDNVAAFDTVSATSLTGNITISSQEAVLALLVYSDAGTITAVTFNGVAPQQLVTVTPGPVLRVYYMNNPPVGNNTIQITGMSATGGDIIGVSLLGVNKAVTPAVFSNSGTSPYVALPVNSPFAQGFALDDLNFGFTTSGTNAVHQGQTPITVGDSASNYYMSSSYKILPAGSANVMQWDEVGALSGYGAVAAIFSPAQAPSFWFPNVTIKNNTIRSHDDRTTEPVPLFMGYQGSTFYQNSFLHTVGRSIPANPPVAPATALTGSMTSQIVIDRITTETVNAVNPTFQHTVSSPDAVMLVLNAQNGAAPAIQVNGTPIPTVVTATNTATASIAYMVNPPVGNVAVTAVTSNPTSFTVITLLGVNKATSNLLSATATASAATIQGSVQVAQANALIIDILIDANLDTLVPLFGEQTQLLNAPVGGLLASAASMRIASPGVQGMGWAGGTATTLAQAMVVLEPSHAPSAWFPNIDERNINDVIQPNNLDSTTLPTATLVQTFGNYASTFWKNSFFQTVGRTIPPGNTGGAVNKNIAQVAATLTFTGGTQTFATVNDVSIAQVAATLTLTGGTQAFATINDVAIAQSAATLTFAGGTQAVATVNNVTVAQVAAVLTFAGGVQVVSATPIVESPAAEGEQQTSQIIIDKVYQATSSAGNPLTIDVSIPSSDAVLVVTGGSVIATGSNWQSVTHNGDLGMNLIDQVTAGADAEVWYFPFPVVGVSRLVVTPAATFGQAYVNAMVLLGVDKKSTNLQVVAASNVGTLASVNLTPDAPNSLMISVLAALDTVGEPTPQQNQNQVFAPAGINTNEYIEVAFQLTSSLQTITYSLGTLANASLVAVTFRPAQAASIWYPNIDLRQLNTVVDAQGLDNGTTPIPGTYGYNEALFYQNSFLHTIGREILGFPVVRGTVTQVAASLTFTGGTQASAATAFVSITQVAATLTFTGGTQVVTTNSSNAQVAAVLTFTGGTQAVAAIRNVSIAQVAAVLTLTGGTQAVATVNNVALSQVAAVLTLTGGTQAAAAIRDVSIAQSAAVLTFSGGTQVIATVNNVSLAQLAATLTFTGGTQVALAGHNINIAQVAATLTFTGGTQSLVAHINAAIAQQAATLTFTGGTQTTLLFYRPNPILVTLEGDLMNISLSGEPLTLELRGETLRTTLTASPLSATISDSSPRVALEGKPMALTLDQ